MKLFRKTILVLMALAIASGLVLTSSEAVSAAVKDPQKCTRWHTVQKGEYLSKIAEQYDTNWYSLAEINQLINPSLIFQGNKLCIFHSNYSTDFYQYKPVISSSASVFATRVTEDKTVTLEGKNLVKNTKYDIYLGKYKTDLGIRYLAGSISSDKNGSFKTTIPIPKKLYDISKIRVSISNQRSNAISNWFINSTSSGNVGGIGSPEPSLALRSVKKGQWVKVDTINLPANINFNIYMNRPGANESKAVLVGTLRDSKGGTVTKTFEIPEVFKERANLKLILVNNALDMKPEVIFAN